MAEKEEKVDFVVVDIMKGEHKQPAHLARQPWGQIPAIEDGDFQLFESRAIIRYLAEKFSNKGPELIPKDAQAKALMEQQISVETSNVTPHVMKLVYQYIFNPMQGKPQDAKVIEEATVAVGKAFDIYEEFLKKHKFLGGNSFGLADIGNAPYFEYLAQSPGVSLIEARPHLAAWWKATSSRPAWQQAIGKAQAPAQ